MYFQVTLKRNMLLHPRNFGPKMREVLRANLKKEVEGTCNGKYGYIVLVTKIHEGEGFQGKLKEGTGWAEFKLQYDAIVFRPFKGEVLECVVREVNKFGFFAECGPQAVFVSELLIHDNFKYSGTDDPSYVSSDGLDRIRKESEVRLKIVGTCIENTEILKLESFFPTERTDNPTGVWTRAQKCIGSIKEDFLGLLSGD